MLVPVLTSLLSITRCIICRRQREFRRDNEDSDLEDSDGSTEHETESSDTDSEYLSDSDNDISIDEHL